MEPLGVAVVIPVLNEGASIAAVISEIPRDVVREIIVVDGGSSDGTAEIAAAAGARVIVPGQHGYGRACLAGGAAASIDCGIIAFIDGDGAALRQAQRYARAAATLRHSDRGLHRRFCVVPGRTLDDRADPVRRTGVSAWGGGVRPRAEEIRGLQIRRKLAASGPFLPSTTSTATRWPSARSVMPARLSTVACTKISLPPRSDPMKPNPFSALYHLTVPLSSTAV